MTAINPVTQIPNSIVTMEQLAAWIGTTLARINPTKAVLETDVTNELVAQVGIFKAADGTERLLVRLSLELDPGYTVDTRKLWMSAKEFSDTVIPAAYTSN